MSEYNRGYLSDFFEGFAIKRLTAVEVDPSTSNQHEFQGIQKLKTMLGTPVEKVSFKSKFLWMNGEGEHEFVDSFVTWSDVRRGKSHRAAEYHLYYSVEAASIVHKASPGDLLLVCKQRNGDLLVVLTETGGTIEQQLSWLFGFPLEEQKGALVRELDATSATEVGFSARFILDELGIETEQTDDSLLDSLLENFGATFPTTRIFSNFARKSLTGISPQDDPDGALIAWMDQEEKLFRTLEKHIVGDRLKDGFYESGSPDVDGFIKFSLSVQNRRKSRAGHALENHLEVIFQTHSVRYSRGAKTEGNKKPDFVFPAIEAYHDLDFPADQLTILGAKSSCKDRWRQVLTEAARVESKHLLTLEPGISENQTNEMQGEKLQLVIPKAIHNTYSIHQQSWLQDLKGFIKTVQQR